MISVLKQKLGTQTGKAVANAGWVFVDRIFRMAAGLVVGIWTARYLGPEQFGLLNYAAVFPAALLSVASLGLTSLLLTELVRQTDYSERDVLGTGFALKFAAGLLTFGLILIASYGLHYDQALMRYMIFFSSFILIFQSADVLDLFFQSKTKSKQSVKAKTVALLISTSLKVYFLVQHYSLLAFSALTLIEVGLTTTLMVLLYQQESGQYMLSWRFSRPLARYLLRLSWPIMVSEFFIFIYMRVNQFMIGGLSSPAELGRFSAALKLSEVWYFVAIAITSSFYPMIVKLKDQDEGAFVKGYQQLLSFLALISITISVGITLFANVIVGLLYGNQYAGVAQILVIHIWSGVFVFLGVGIGNWFVLHGLQRILLYKTIAGAVLNVLLNLLLIPRFGAVGASIATLIAYFVSAYAMNSLFGKTKIVFQMQTTAIANAFRLDTVKSLWQRFA